MIFQLKFVLLSSSSLSWRLLHGKRIDWLFSSSFCSLSSFSMLDDSWSSFVIVSKRKKKEKFHTSRTKSLSINRSMSDVRFLFHRIVWSNRDPQNLSPSHWRRTNLDRYRKDEIGVLALISFAFVSRFSFFFMIMCNPQLNQQTYNEDNIENREHRLKRNQEISFRRVHLELFVSLFPTRFRINICPLSFIIMINIYRFPFLIRNR